ncbi:MAG: EipA family protein [Hyphomicrobiaceae bacterium]
MMRTTWGRAARAPIAAVVLLAAFTAASPSVHAQTCSEEEIGRVIDGTGEMLRTVNDEYSPKLTSKLEIVAATRELSEAELADYARKLMREPEIMAAEAKASELLGRIEAVGDEATGESATCDKLKIIEANATELKTTIVGKYEKLFANIDADLAGKPKKAEEKIAKAEPKPAPKAEPAPKLPAPEDTEPAIAAPVDPQAEPAVPDAPSDWSAEAQQGSSGIVEYEPVAPNLGPRISALDEELTTYSSDEILSAGKGFFGSVTTGLAGVITYAFQQAGRPSGYIFGSEGSVAFIAGLRYGKGRLHTKLGGGRTVYWQGPSIGTDAGAEGARTLILVYNLKEPADIFAHFGGVDGSAYVVGGVGITFLTDGDLVLAPIRSGLGLRLGANIGYLKFTPERSIIPF